MNRVNIVFDATVSINATSTSATASIGTAGNAVLFSNKGDKWATIKLGATGVTASSDDLPLAPNQQVVLDRGKSQTHFAAITEGADTTTVKATPCYVA